MARKTLRWTKTTLVIEAVEIEAKVRVRSRRDLDDRREDRHAAAREARDEREYA